MPAESLAERHIRYLRYAELQFLLAYKVNWSAPQELVQVV
jgi:hypothetical protein